MRRPSGWPQIESHPESPPLRVWRDWLLVGAVAALTVADVVRGDELAWRLVTLAYGVALAFAVAWRRTRPLAMAILGVGALIAVDVGSGLAASGPFYPYAGTLIVVLVYALFRWGTSRQAAIGAVIVASEWVLSTVTDFTGATDAVGGLAVLLLAGTLGVATRYRRIAWTQHLEQVRIRERELLARELHDTVAHHVSAIAIQAQAGGFLVSSSDLPGAAEALATIEAEATRTLVEMRSIVGYLRRGDEPGTPGTVYGLADIDDLAITGTAPGPQVEVERCGGLDDLPPAVEASLYRAAQESITNSRRHARNVTRVHIRLYGETDTIRLTIADDGDRVSAPLRAPGYGLVGMAERVRLVGGSVEAGPLPGRGWSVQVTIPRPKVPA